MANMAKIQDKLAILPALPGCYLMKNKDGDIIYVGKAKKLKKKVCDAFHKISGQAEEMLDTAKEKVLDTGAAVADKVADKTFDLAEKADDLKGKMHTIAADAKK